ncbi:MULTISPECIES: SCO2523 family variant P-loop protein [Streptomyces]|uniref:SCO2523 family variant P-loop protein n=1 Tax=Streptomyces sp. NBC_00093 TaxID=2975649 RepID=A0AAU1ZU30_9ACTN
MIVFAASDKGGTGRSVTTANLAYRRALAGDDVCYLDFDFGSPTAAAVFEVSSALRGIEKGGLHSYFQGRSSEPARLDVWAGTEHPELRPRPTGSGRLVLLPGDRGGGEFSLDRDAPHRCVDLFLRLNNEFDVIMVDLSAGRSFAMDLVLEATSRRELSGLVVRWLVYHRWTRQHVIAAAGLAFGDRGIVAGGTAHGHTEDELRGAIRFVRAAVPDLDSPQWSHVTPAQSAWMRERGQLLDELAAQCEVGFSRVLGRIPLEPVLQWREQLITDEDVLGSGIVTMETHRALEDLAGKLSDDDAWGQP